MNDLWNSGERTSSLTDQPRLHDALKHDGLRMLSLPKPPATAHFSGQPFLTFFHPRPLNNRNPANLLLLDLDVRHFR